MLLPKSNAWLVSFLMVSNRPTRCSEPLRFKVGGASKPFAMVVRAGTARGKVGVFMRIIGAVNKKKSPKEINP